MLQEWIHEEHTDGYGVKWKITEVLHEEQTKYQKLSVVNTVEWGRTLILDGNVQTTETDEYIYHEMMVHPAMNTHDHVEKVLIIGGGDGGVLKEIVKYDTVTKIDMVEIDEGVVNASKKYFPKISSGFVDQRVNLLIEDGIQYVKNCTTKYDLVIIDSSDPIGPAIGLYSKDFYQDVFSLLKEAGIMVAQSESPMFYREIFQSIYKNISDVFPQQFVYLASIPTYIAGPWAFTMAIKRDNPLKIASDIEPLTGLQYYNKNIHCSAFSLPEYIKKLLLA
ncbi:MAG: polyamine aminopropyltransferase [Bacillota bacterium]|nr:polyamine aminopropyltransferase [Bacillota bacterium]